MLARIIRVEHRTCRRCRRSCGTRTQGLIAGGTGRLWSGSQPGEDGNRRAAGRHHVASDQQSSSSPAKQPAVLARGAVRGDVLGEHVDETVGEVEAL